WGDFPEVRQSTIRQVVETYLKMTGKDVQLGALGTTIVVRAAETAADKWFAERATPEALLKLLSQGSVAGSSITATPPLGSSLPSAWQLWNQSSYFLRRFEIVLPA